MQAFELGILNWIQNDLRCGALDAVMPAISRICDHGEVWILLALLLLVIPKTRKAGFSLACALVIDLLLCNLWLKPLFGRSRPFVFQPDVSLLVAPPSDASFPSGHTASSFAAAFSLYAAGDPLWKPSFVLAAVIAVSRLYLYVHWPSDILGGILIGVLSGWLGAKLAQRSTQKFTRK